MSFSQLQTGHLRDGVLAGSTLQRAIQFGESLATQTINHCSTWNTCWRDFLKGVQWARESKSRHSGNTRNLRVLSSRRHFSLFSHQEVPLQRFRYQNWFLPLPLLRFLRFFQISAADPKNYAACVNPVRSRPFQKWTKFTHRSRANEFQWR